MRCARSFFCVLHDEACARATGVFQRNKIQSRSQNGLSSRFKSTERETTTTKLNCTSDGLKARSFEMKCLEMRARKPTSSLLPRPRPPRVWEQNPNRNILEMPCDEQNANANIRTVAHLSACSLQRARARARSAVNRVCSGAIINSPLNRSNFAQTSRASLM